jgi:zinc protease
MTRRSTVAAIAVMAVTGAAGACGGGGAAAPAAVLPAAAPASAPTGPATAAPPSAAASSPTSPTGPAPFDRSGIADWIQPPAPGAEPASTPPTARRSKLKNGVAVVVIENHTLPIAAINVLVQGAGAAADPRHKRGLAAFTADMVDEGAGGLSALAISEEAGRLGAEIATRADADSARISVGALTRTLDPTLDLLAKIATQPAFAPAELERVKGDRLTALDQRRDRPPEIAQLVLDEALYGIDSAYGHAGDGARDEVQAITAGDVQAFYREHWNPAAMTIVVAGDVDAAAITARLDAVLGGWRPAGARPPVTPAVAPAKLTRRLLLVDRPGAAQSDVRIGRIGPDRHDKRYFAFEVLRAVLGDGFTSRLTHRLREQLGITYGVRASMVWRKARGPFVIASAIVTAKTATGIAETIKILDDLATTDVSAAELDNARQNMIRALPARFETNAGTAAAFTDLALHGLPDDWYAQFAGAVRKVTAADVKAVAKALIPSGTLAIAIVGDVGKIRPELDKLGLGAPAAYDLHAMPVAGR